MNLPPFRTCAICGVMDIPFGVDWPWWVGGQPVHQSCQFGFRLVQVPGAPKDQLLLVAGPITCDNNGRVISAPNCRLLKFKPEWNDEGRAPNDLPGGRHCESGDDAGAAGDATEVVHGVASEAPTGREGEREDDV